MIPAAIKRDHVVRAIALIAAEGVPKGRESRDYDILHEGRRYPPKLVLARASLLATGRELLSSEFGGGTETNSYLASLGFEIRRKAGTAVHVPPAPEPASGASRPPEAGAPVRLARVWMNLGLSRSEFARRGSDLWATHRAIVRAEYAHDPVAYLARRAELVERAATGDVEVLLLPACAIIDVAIPALLPCLRPIPLMVSGVLSQGARPNREGGFVAEAGEAPLAYDNAHVIRLDTCVTELWAAISSTVTSVYHTLPARPGRRGESRGRTTLVLDSGHHPYSGHYYCQSLRCVTREVSAATGGRVATVLSSWRYAGMNMTCRWHWPADGATILESHTTAAGDVLEIMTVR